jgi:hypothetical protein
MALLLDLVLIALMLNSQIWTCVSKQNMSRWYERRTFGVYRVSFSRIHVQVKIFCAAGVNFASIVLTLNLNRVCPVRVTEKNIVLHLHLYSKFILPILNSHRIRPVASKFMPNASRHADFPPKLLRSIQIPDKFV